MASPEDVVKNTNQGDDVTEVEEEESSTSNDNNNEPPATQEEELTETAIEEMARGMVYASLAITDDKENTLEKVSAYIGISINLLSGTAVAALSYILARLGFHLTVDAP